MVYWHTAAAAVADRTSTARVSAKATDALTKYVRLMAADWKLRLGAGIRCQGYAASIG